MTLEEKYELSCYQELTKLHETKEIYLVQNTDTREIYAKKVVDVYNKPVYQALMELKLPNVPKIIALFEADNQLIVIEEYIHGVSLEKWLREHGTMQEEEAARIMKEVCDILRSLHKHQPPIIHRDLKPSNIMLSQDKVVKLIDFNAAKEYADGKNEDTRLIGTQDFAAPEQYGFGQSSPQTDIYALGVTMNYLLTGDYPKNQLWKGRLKPVIQKCIHINPQERYTNVMQLKTAIETVMRTRSKNILVRSLYPYQKYAPVGFRSGALWKMFLAIFGYLLILATIVTTKVESGGQPVTGILLWLNWLGYAVAMLGVIFLIGNYGGIRYALPFMKGNKALHWILTFIYCILYVFVVFFILALVMTVLEYAGI